MHLCFIVDNGLPLLQPAWGNASILDYVKSCIQTMLREISRNGGPAREHQHQILHLFATSNPQAPISSFEHDNSHFNYQLKSIECRPITFPAETIAAALKHIGKFRALTETETLLGYREGTVYEAALVLFFTSALTQRKIAKIESWIPKMQMRCEYKLVSFQLCLGAKSEKIDQLKAWVEGSGAAAQLGRTMQRLNRGELRNIYKWSGRESLLDTLIKLFNIYRPNLCVDFKLVGSEGVPEERHSEFFSSSDLNLQSILGEEDTSVTSKVFLVSMLAPPRHRTQIPLPQKIRIKETELEVDIDEIVLPKFTIDCTKRLSQALIDRTPFENYRIMTCSTITKIEKEVSRSNQGAFFFPVYQDDAQAGMLMIGLLRVGPPNETELLISYGNFPQLAKIIVCLQNRKSYADNKNIESMLKEYTKSIPEYYLKFLNHFFSCRFGIEIPTASSNRLLVLQKKLQQLRLKQRNRVHELGEESLRRHQTNTSLCCPVLSQNYKEFSSSISKNNQKLSVSEAVMAGLLQKVSEIESKYKIRNYFSNSNTSKCVSVTQELEKYSMRRGDEEFFSENIAAGLGNPYKKKKKNAAETLEDLAEDTPMVMPEYNGDPQPMQQVPDQLYETILAEQMKDGTGIEGGTIEEEPQVNYDSEQMQAESRQQEMDEDSERMMEQINGYGFEEAHRRLFNPRNLEAALHHQNVRRLKQVGLM